MFNCLTSLPNLYYYRNFGLYRCRFPRTDGQTPDATIRRLSLNPADLQDRLEAAGFEVVYWHGRCNPDELLQGHFEVLAGMEGTYALFFDNTFSKNTSKTVLFSQRISPVSPQLISQSSHGTLNELSTSDVTPNASDKASTSSSHLGAAPHAASSSGPSPRPAGLATPAPTQLPSNKPGDRRSVLDLGFDQRSRPISIYTDSTVQSDGSEVALPAALSSSVLSFKNNVSNGSLSVPTNGRPQRSSSVSSKINDRSPNLLSVAPPVMDHRKSSVTITTQSVEKKDFNRSTCVTDGRYIKGILLKKRRKKLQGYARRYFSLDYRYGTFNYYISEKNSILRGSMPIKFCAISAISRSREIFVDSGMEVWNLKALTQGDFNAWTEAFDTARSNLKLAAKEGPSHSEPPNLLKASLVTGSSEATIPPVAVSPNCNVNDTPKHSSIPNTNDELYLQNLSNIVKKLETISLKAKESAGNQEKERQASAHIVPQRRQSFWRRRSSRQQLLQEVSEQVAIHTENVDPLSKTGSVSSSSSNSGTHNESTNNIPLQSPPLNEDVFRSGSNDEFSKLNISDSRDYSPTTCTSTTSFAAVSNNTQANESFPISSVGGASSPNSLVEISQSVDGVVEELKNLIIQQRNSLVSQSKIVPDSGAFAAVAGASALALALGTPIRSPGSNGEAGTSIAPGSTSSNAHYYAKPELTRSLSDNMSVFSADEFFDAQEFSKTQDGIVYIDKEDSQSSSDEEEGYRVAGKPSEDVDNDSLSDSDNSDTDDDVTVHHAHTIPAATDLAEVKTVDGEPHLYPLEEVDQAPVRRDNIPPAAVAPPSLISLVRKSVGKDLSTIAMPVSTNEPITILQRMCELFEYTELIDKAFTQPDGSPERILLIAAFANSYLSSGRAKERATRKPFNPLLGETFEMVRPEQGFRAITEKVSHRPLIMAIQAESPSWIFQYSPNPHQQFWGKSAEINNKGTARLSHLPSGEIYEWSQPTTFLRNVIAGEKYVEPVGTLTVISSTGAKAVVEYKSGSMFSGRSEDLKATVYDTNGNLLKGYGFEGKWTQSLEMTAGSKKEKIWEVGKLVDNYAKRFGFTEYAASLNEITPIEKGKIAPTDSRLRPDQRTYEEGNVDKAETWKLQLEESQRQRRKEMEEKGVEYKPKFFEFDAEDNVWKLIGGDKNYWRRRHVGDWAPNQLDDLFKL